MSEETKAQMYVQAMLDAVHVEKEKLDNEIMPERDGDKLLELVGMDKALRRVMEFLKAP